jgi:hypothetical protein
MAKEPLVATRTCPTHGVVEATKTVPGVFPVLAYLPRLAASSIRGYRCPQCGAKTT